MFKRLKIEAVFSWLSAAVAGMLLALFIAVYSGALDHWVRAGASPSAGSYRDELRSKWVTDWGPESVALYLQLLAFVAQAAFLGMTIKTMKATEARQLRAYVFATGADVNRSYQDRRLDAFVFSFPFENGGLTTATDLHIWVAFDIFPTSENREPSFTKSPSFTGTVMGPRARAQTDYRAVSIDDMQSVWTWDKEVFIWFRVEYRDVFEPRNVRHHQQCLRVSLIRDPSLPLPQGHPEIVVLSAYGSGNSAD